MEGLLIGILVLLLIGGLLYFLWTNAPFIPEPFKAWGAYAIIAVVAIIAVLKFLVPLLKSVSF